MPFPPTFDHPWDITQPPDTQLANLLGQDIRNLKDDVMQRMSLLSGTLANRPTPETVNATWGGTGFGLMYFSTDSNQIFQWSGAAWVDITASFFNTGVALKRYTDITQYSYGAPGTYDTTGVSIPNTVFGSGSHFRIFAHGNASSAATLRLKITTSSLSTITIFSAGISNDFAVEAEFFASGHGAQGYYNVFSNGALGTSAQSLALPFPVPPGANPTQVFTEYVVTGGVITQNNLGVRVFT